MFLFCCCHCSVAQSCLTLCDPMDCSPPGSSVHGDSPGKNTGVGSHTLLQGLFPTQGSNPGLPYCRRILYHLSHQGSPRILEWVAYPFSRGSSQPRNQTGVSCIAGRFFTSWSTRENSNYLQVMWKPSNHEQKYRCLHKVRERAFHMNPQSTASALTLSAHKAPTMTAHVAARCSVLCNQARNEPFVSVSLSLCPPFLSWRCIRISKNASSYFPLLLFSTSVYNKSNSFWKKSQRLLHIFLNNLSSSST